MWMTILKENLIPRNREAWTTAIAASLSAGSEGTERISNIVSDAMEDDAKRTRQTVKIVSELKDLSEEELGERFSFSGESLENLVNGLEELSEALSEIVVEKPPLRIERFDTAIESLKENNVEDLKVFLGSGPRAWGGKTGQGRITRKDMIKLLNDNEDLIREKTDGNIDLWYYDLSDNTITVPKDGQKQLEAELQGLDDMYNLEGDTLTFPEKISVEQWSELKGPLNALVTTFKVPELKKKSSPLLQVFPEEEDVSSDVKTRIEEFTAKNYTNLISRDNLINYFKLTTKQGWPTKLLLPELEDKHHGNKNDVLNTIYVNRSSLPPVVKTLLSTHTFDLAKMMDEGASYSETKMVPETIREILIEGTGAIEGENAKYKGIVRPEDEELTMQDIADLSDKYREIAIVEEGGRDKHYGNRFLKWLKSGKTEAVSLRDKYKVLESRTQTTKSLMLFSEKEAKSLWALSQYKPFDDKDKRNAFRKELRELYETKRVRRIQESLMQILSASDNIKDMFVNAGETGEYRLNSDLRIRVAPTVLAQFAKLVKGLRHAKSAEQSKEGDVIESDPVKIIQRVHKETGSDLEWNDAYSIHHVTPQDILQALIYLDYWYGDMGLNELKNDYLDSYSEENDDARNEALETLITACGERFSNIMDSLVEKTKEKVDDIINNPQKYVEGLSKRKQIYHLSGPLLDAGIIKEGEQDG